MRIFEYAILHPNLQNDDRAKIHEWCEEVIGPRYETWWDGSNYDEHGTFNITISGRYREHMVAMFLLKYPNTKIIEINYAEGAGFSEEVLQLFEGLI